MLINVEHLTFIARTNGENDLLKYEIRGVPYFQQMNTDRKKWGWAIVFPREAPFLTCPVLSIQFWGTQFWPKPRFGTVLLKRCKLRLKKGQYPVGMLEISNAKTWNIPGSSWATWAPDASQTSAPCNTHHTSPPLVDLPGLCRAFGEDRRRCCLAATIKPPPVVS